MVPADDVRTSWAKAPPAFVGRVSTLSRALGVASLRKGKRKPRLKQGARSLPFAEMFSFFNFPWLVLKGFCLSLLDTCHFLVFSQGAETQMEETDKTMGSACSLASGLLSAGTLETISAWDLWIRRERVARMWLSTQNDC